MRLELILRRAESFVASPWAGKPIDLSRLFRGVPPFVSRKRASALQSSTLPGSGGGSAPASPARATSRACSSSSGSPRSSARATSSSGRAAERRLEIPGERVRCERARRGFEAGAHDVVEHRLEERPETLVAEIVLHVALPLIAHGEEVGEGGSLT